MMALFIIGAIALMILYIVGMAVTVLYFCDDDPDIEIKMISVIWININVIGFILFGIFTLLLWTHR